MSKDLNLRGGSNAALPFHLQIRIPIMVNINCLSEMQCPQCGSFEPFLIEVTTMMKVYDNGTDTDYGDTELEDTSRCHCWKCGFSGTVADFRKPHPTATGGAL